MQWEQLSFLDPKYLYRSHPFDLRSNCESDPRCERLDSALPINCIQPTAWVSRREELARMGKGIETEEGEGIAIFRNAVHYARENL